MGRQVKLVLRLRAVDFKTVTASKCVLVGIKCKVVAVKPSSTEPGYVPNYPVYGSYIRGEGELVLRGVWSLTVSC